jgi:DNA topoisomerase-1
LLRRLIHNGVVVPPTPGPYNLILTIRGHGMALTPEQEEMAMAWARKLGTEYVEDPVFARNFLADFSTALGIEPPLKLEEVDFSPAADIVARERAAREALTKEERKAQAAERKAAREALRERYGHATVDGERTELGTYLVEPSGKHPLRGRWKEGPKASDITLNLSRDAPRPEGDWAEIVWEPDSMWVARWKDKLSGKTKYIWLGDSATVKQNKEAGKFDKATRLGENLDAVRRAIESGLDDEEPRRRMVATACFLIDHLCLRVGDEKDPDEADTVGATTLRPEHVTLHEDGTVEFRFLGKDSVLWHKKVGDLPEAVRRNLAELVANARPSGNGRSVAGDRPQLFPDIGSRDVNAFLAEMQKGLTAKVFRTCHATMKVKASLEGSGVAEESPEYRKRAAVTQANLDAAVLCNHYKKAPARWPERRAKIEGRRKDLAERVTERREQARLAREALEAVRAQAKAKVEAATTDRARERARASGRKAIERAQKKVDTARARLDKARETLDRFESKAALTARARTWNLGTSLKSYIDPRAYHVWGREVGYDVLATYYPKTLQKKFAWVRAEEEPAEPEQPVAEGVG